jgi:hypothetical protein
VGRAAARPGRKGVRAVLGPFGQTGRHAKDLKIAHLEEKLVKKNEVVAELMEAHVQLKKELGEL